jgi:hypothetical protein
LARTLSSASAITVLVIVSFTMPTPDSSVTPLASSVGKRAGEARRLDLGDEIAEQRQAKPSRVALAPDRRHEAAAAIPHDEEEGHAEHGPPVAAHELAEHDDDEGGNRQRLACLRERRFELRARRTREGSRPTPRRRARAATDR